MKEDEARLILKEQLDRLRGQGYRPVGFEVAGLSGTGYNIDIEAVRDHERGRDLRVWVLIDDGSVWRSLSPLNDNFIIRPDGSFVGE